MEHFFKTVLVDSGYSALLNDQNNIKHRCMTAIKMLKMLISNKLS